MRRALVLCVLGIIGAISISAAISYADVLEVRELNLQINNRDDDYKESSSGASTRSDQNHDLWTSADVKQAYRFSVVNIPRNSVILEATLSVYSTTTGTSNALQGIAQGQASSNAPAWTGANYEITNAAKTTSQVTISNLPTWTGNAFNEVANVQPIVQELVNRSTWFANGAMKFFLIGTSTAAHRRTKTYDGDSSQAAKLYIRYAESNLCGNGRVIELASKSGAISALDVGWTGAGHDTGLSTTGAALTITTNCTQDEPPCTDCGFYEVVRNRKVPGSLQNQRCTHNSAVECRTDTTCSTLSAGSTCRLFYGSPLPVSASYTLGSNYSLTACATSYVSGSPSGYVNPSDGTLSAFVPLTTKITPFTIQSTPQNANACPRCNGDTTANDGIRSGTCNSGPNNGLACDANQQGNLHFGSTSLDCPASPTGATTTSNALVGDTVGATATISGDSPACIGSSGQCMCQTCNNSYTNLIGCFTDDDCPETSPGVAGICGGERCKGGIHDGHPCGDGFDCGEDIDCSVPGSVNKRNGCNDGTCTAGECLAGPTDSFCGPSAPAHYVICSTNSQCANFGVCSNDATKRCTTNGQCTSPGTCVLDTCQSTLHPCFGDTVAAEGSIDSSLSGGVWDATLASLGCAAPGTDQLVNETLGLPGLNRVEWPIHVQSFGVP